MKRYVEIVQVIRDYSEAYLAVRYFDGNDSVLFHWEIDELTCDRIEQAMLAAKKSLGDGGTFRLSLVTEPSAFDSHAYGVIIYISGANEERLPFLCTMQFAANIQWLNELTGIQTLNEAAIGEQAVGAEFGAYSQIDLAELKEEVNSGIMNNRRGRNIISKRRWKTRIAAAAVLSVFFLFTPILHTIPGNISFLGIETGARLNHSDGMAGGQRTLVQNNQETVMPEVEAFRPDRETGGISVNDADRGETTVSDQNNGTGHVSEDQQNNQADHEPAAPAENDAMNGSIIGYCTTKHSSSGTDNKLPVLRGNAPGTVSLTFDDGPSRFTEQIVNVLDEYKVKGTFFFVGTQISKWPDLVKFVSERGHAIGNHSVSHSDLTKLSDENIRKEIISNGNRIADVTGEPVTLFRPPYGRWNARVASILKEESMVLAFWNRDPRDWAATSPKQVIHAVVNDKPSGGVYVLHESEHTLEALPHILEKLLEEGLDIVPLGSAQNVVECM